MHGQMLIEGVLHDMNIGNSEIPRLQYIDIDKFVLADNTRTYTSKYNRYFLLRNFNELLLLSPIHTRSDYMHPNF